MYIPNKKYFQHKKSQSIHKIKKIAFIPFYVNAVDLT